ncbi:VIT1/CCC1 transporter family protein, partial [Candidatus Bathyarchaeota archaeon]|nr:VIT1/CCC1 transporter family protein [Candidatus Bathyarchaeota archaeon]
EMERALLTDLEDTEIAKLVKTAAIVISLINFITPLIACAVSITPFTLAYLGVIEVQEAAWISIGVTIGTLFSAGVYIGRDGKGNAILKGIKMVIFGIIAFLIGYCIEMLI